MGNYHDKEMAALGGVFVRGSLSTAVLLFREAYGFFA